MFSAHGARKGCMKEEELTKKIMATGEIPKYLTPLEQSIISSCAKIITELEQELAASRVAPMLSAVPSEDMRWTMMIVAGALETFLKENLGHNNLLYGGHRLDDVQKELIKFKNYVERGIAG